MDRQAIALFRQQFLERRSPQHMQFILLARRAYDIHKDTINHEIFVVAHKLQILFKPDNY
jgi:hypothetical protein